MKEINLKLDSACAYSKDAGVRCMSDETANKIKLISDIPNYNKELVNKIIDESNGSIDELKLLLNKRVVEELGPEAVKEELKNYKPLGPTDNSYFNNFVENNFVHHLHHYDSTFKDFEIHLHDFPNHSYTAMNELPNMTDKIKSGEMKTFGCVLNTLVEKDLEKAVNGVVKKVGHWVAMFGDFRNDKLYTIEYFNSSGQNAPKIIFDFMSKLAKKIETDTGVKTIPVNVSNIAHQKSNTECGAYAMYYIAARLIGYPYKKFRVRPISDDHVNKFRSHALNSQSDLPIEHPKSWYLL